MIHGRGAVPGTGPEAQRNREGRNIFPGQGAWKRVMVLRLGVRAPAAIRGALGLQPSDQDVRACRHRLAVRQCALTLPAQHSWGIIRYTLNVQADRAAGMIRSFGDLATRRFFQGSRLPEYEGFGQRAARRLTVLNAATSLQDLRAMPKNRLEVLSGRRAGPYGLRINQEWRLRFLWERDGPHRVQIVNCHG